MLFLENKTLSDQGDVYFVDTNVILKNKTLEFKYSLVCFKF